MGLFRIGKEEQGQSQSPQKEQLTPQEEMAQEIERKKNNAKATLEKSDELISIKAALKNLDENGGTLAGHDPLEILNFIEKAERGEQIEGRDALAYVTNANMGLRKRVRVAIEKNIATQEQASNDESQLSQVRSELSRSDQESMPNMANAKMYYETIKDEDYELNLDFLKEGLQKMAQEGISVGDYGAGVILNQVELAESDSTALRGITRKYKLRSRVEEAIKKAA